MQQAEHKHDELVKKAVMEMPDIDILYDLAELFKVFADSTRVRILYLLLQQTMCVCGIAQALDMTVSAVSHQLRILKSANLVKFKREGKTIFYSLADSHVRLILDQGMEHLEE